MRLHPQPSSSKQGTGKIDSILLIGFGGPTPGCCQRFNPCLSEGQTAPEAYCFVSEILAQRMREQKPILDSDRGKEASLSPQVPVRPDQARINEVVTHYIELGGFSPFNDLTFEQASALEDEVGVIRPYGEEEGEESSDPQRAKGKRLMGSGFFAGGRGTSQGKVSPEVLW